MTVKNKFLAFFVVGAISCFIFWGEGVSALTISPPVREMTGDPGTKISGIIKLYNETNKDLSVTPSQADFGAKETGDGEPEFFELNGKDSKDLASWIKIPSGPFAIRSLDWQNIVFEIDIPKDAEPGGHYAAVFFSPQQSEKDGGGAVSVDYKTGTLILLTVSGKMNENGNLKSFSLKDGKKFYDHIPVNFELSIENKGNVHFKPAGNVTVKSMFGGSIAELPVLKVDSGGNILPRSNRRFEIVWGDLDEKKMPKTFWEKARYEWANFYVGRYSALASVTLPGSGQVTSNVSFWVFPWQLLVVIAIAFIIFFWLFGRYNRWIVKKAREKK
jgi:hypothetical protein